jgi:glycerol-3-phosphate dehydrogenase (NAD(P)+)
MSRLVAYFGGSPESLMGLAGVGDLMLTASSELSRNFQVGMRRAKGQTLEQILQEMTQVAEGIQASRAVHLWPVEHGLQDWPELPIAIEVYRFLHENEDPREALARLMRRPPKAEAL